jgi:hypothetical protein
MLMIAARTGLPRAAIYNALDGRMSDLTQHLLSQVLAEVPVRHDCGQCRPQTLLSKYRGRKHRLASMPPPSEPDVRISRIRLSGWWSYLRED